MRSSETRTVNQCTHVRLKPQTAHAFLMTIPKLQVAMLAFGDPAKTDAILDKLVVPPGSAFPKALELLWAGDLGGFAEAAADLEFDTLTHLANQALDAERDLLKSAQVEMRKAVEDVIARPRVYGLVSRSLSPVVVATALSLAELEAALQPEPSGQTAEGPPRRSLESLVFRRIERRSPDVAAILSVTGIINPHTVASAPPAAAQTVPLAALDIKLLQLDKSQAYLNTLASLAKTHPVGYLALERINFTAIGYTRGELVYSLPMLPGETVRLSHREWTRTEQEYSSLVQSSIEKDLEEVVSEKSELTESYGSQQQHTSAFNASASVSGGYGPVSFSSSVGYNTTNAESTSRQSSARRAQENSRKAASRSKQEHKVSFRVASQYEIEEQNFREFKNDSQDAVRWDFHRLMKKWRLDLYRYGARLTYDIVIPEPGSYLLRRHLLLKAIETELARPLAFDASIINISTSNNAKDPHSWVALQEKYGAALEPPPSSRVFSWEQSHPYQGSPSDATHFLDMTLPDGYEFDATSCTAQGDNVAKGNDSVGTLNERKAENLARMQSLKAPMERFAWHYYVGWSDQPHADSGDQLTLSVSFVGKPGERLLLNWQAECYERLKQAAEARYVIRQQQLTAVHDELADALTREDSLMLRKLEKEELMKGALRWVLGPGFDFYPNSLMPLTLPTGTAGGTEPPGDLEYYTNLSGQGVVPQAFESMVQHGEIVEFLNQAIEWENVNYVLYPYFWTDDSRWDFKQALYHPEYFHRMFLRAGAARVVLPIRPGWERRFIRFSQTLKLDATIPDEAHNPYMTIADEMEAMAKTTYAYTESPNKECDSNLVKHWYEFTPTGALDVVAGSVLLADEDMDADD